MLSHINISTEKFHAQMMEATLGPNLVTRMQIKLIKMICDDTLAFNGWKLMLGLDCIV